MCLQFNLAMQQFKKNSIGMFNPKVHSISTRHKYYEIIHPLFNRASLVIKNVNKYFGYDFCFSNFRSYQNFEDKKIKYY